MKIAVGSDHTGVRQRGKVRELLEQRGIDVQEIGPQEGEPSDYPLVSRDVGRAVAEGQADLGIIVCGTGIGVSIAANKVRGVLAAAAYDAYTVEMSRRHNHANVLCLGARTLSDEEIVELVKVFLDTPVEGGRHERRVKQILQMDQEQ